MSAKPSPYTASDTWREILQQPQIWEGWAQTFDAQSHRQWVDEQDFDEVWFCGAGTSAFIGDIITNGLAQNSKPVLRSVASTDLVARPAHYLSGQQRLLVVNFGRSGDSTESLGTLEAVRNLAPKAQMLNITCNPDGALANVANARVITLPSQCHDVGFAMTSSFSTMLLTALSIFDRDTDPATKMVNLANHAAAALPKLEQQFLKTAMPPRVVYLGAGALAFVARESALKVLELSAGQIPALWDTSLGFRHGPKSFVTDDTAINILMSSDKQTRKYDEDLVTELRAQFPLAQVNTVGANGTFDITTTVHDLWDSVLAVLPAQVSSVIWSAQLGLNVDDPFIGRSTLSRVVSGVRLHPVVGGAL